MPRFRGIAPVDLQLMRRLTIAIIIVVALVAAFHRLNLLYSHKFYDVTGNAQWIWDKHEISAGKPLAFFAARDFDLPEKRYFTKIKVLGDPEYTIYFNGHEIGGRRSRETSALEVFDVTPLARTGRNRIVVTVRSSNGVGGLIAAVDISPEAQNLAATGKEWKIFREWREEMPLRDPAGVRAYAPMLLGRPPTKRWNYLTRVDGRPAQPPGAFADAQQVFSFVTAISKVKVISGVAVTVAERTSATAFDFGPTKGRLQLTLAAAPRTSTMIRVRFAGERNELFAVEGEVRPYVFAAGERTIIDPEVHAFRYVSVYASKAKARVAR